MRVWRKLLPLGAWSVLFVLLILGALPAPAQQAAPKVEEIPDSPSAVLAKLAEPAQPQGSLAQTPGVSAPPQSQLQPADAAAPQKPVGTAAAEAPNSTGVAASQPAGIAMAPAKQRRVRTIIIRTGAIIGAGVAVGSVVALTAGTSSRPPGAH